jgi:hypothetical protein
MTKRGNQDGFHSSKVGGVPPSPADGAPLSVKAKRHLLPVPASLRLNALSIVIFQFKTVNNISTL